MIPAVWRWKEADCVELKASLGLKDRKTLPLKSKQIDKNNPKSQLMHL